MTSAEARKIAQPLLDKGAKAVWVSENGHLFIHESLAERYARLEDVKVILVNSTSEPAPDEVPATPKAETKPRRKRRKKSE